MFNREYDSKGDADFYESWKSEAEQQAKVKKTVGGKTVGGGLKKSLVFQLYNRPLSYPLHPNTILVIVSFKRNKYTYDLPNIQPSDCSTKGSPYLTRFQLILGIVRSHP